MDDNIYKNYQVIEGLWIERGVVIVKLLRANTDLVEALEAIVERAYKTDGTAYVMSGSCMQQARDALKLAKGE